MENNKKNISRTKMREQVFCLLFEYTFLKDNDEQSASDLYDTAVKLYEYSEDNYVKTAFFGVVKNIEELDGIISKYAVGWSTQRMSRVSLSLMRLCLYECRYIEDVPVNAAINEAIELCKKYDTEQAPAFINGVLNSAVKGENIDK